MTGDSSGGWSLRGDPPLPYGVFADASTPRPRVGVLVADGLLLDLTAGATSLLPAAHAGLFRGGTLDPLLAAGPQVWRAVRTALVHRLSTGSGSSFAALAPLLLPTERVAMRLPFTVADYVDFYSCEQHATNAGRIFRPGSPPLPANWRHLPVGYHGRAGTVVVSGTPVARPCGQRRGRDGTVSFGPSTALDFEAEVGFVVGTPSRLGQPVALAGFADHVFGLCLVNDWSARDIQAFESVPLGPFLGKSFATSISPWVVPLDALRAAWVAPPPRDPRPPPHLDDSGLDPAVAGGLDLTLEVRLNGQLISRPPFAGMYWTAAQQLAHLTSNGAALRTGDLYASGTVSGPDRDQWGSLLELSWNAARPLTLPDGATRGYLADGDEVRISATAPGPDGRRIALGDVRGRITPAGPVPGPFI